MIDKVINLVLAIVISTLVGIIAFNLFYPQAEMEAQQPAMADRVHDLLAQVDEAVTMQQEKRASSTLAEALKLAEELGPDNPELARVLDKRGDFLMSKKERRNGLADWDRALKIFERAHGLEYDSAREMSLKIARYLEKRQDYSRAEHYLKRGLKVTRLADDEDKQGKFWLELARVKEAQGKYDEAEECRVRARKLMKPGR